MPFTNNDDYSFWSAWKPVPAIYGIMNAMRLMIYIGETEDLQRRMSEHQSDKLHCMHRYGPALVVVEVNYGGEFMRRMRESQLIAEYRPLCNA